MLVDKIFMKKEVSLMSTSMTAMTYPLKISGDTKFFSSSVQKYFTSELSKQVKYFFNTRREISYLQVAM